MLISVYDAHKNKNNNDKRVIGIAQLHLSAVQKIRLFPSVPSNFFMILLSEQGDLKNLIDFAQKSLYTFMVNLN